MLCTRIRLVERRYSMARETPDGVLKSSESNLPGSSSLTSVKTIQRPCIIRNLSNNCGSDDITTSALTTVTAITTPIQQQTAIQHSALRTKKDSRKKPSLIVVSLGIQPGTKTLAQNNIKRDPRKLPTFCNNYKQQKNRIIISSELNNNNNNNNEKIKNDDLFVRGIEIISDQQTKSELTSAAASSSSVHDGSMDTNSNINCNYIPNELNIQLTDCCQCIRDIYEKRNFENLQKILTNSNSENNNNNNNNDICKDLESTMESTTNFQLTIQDYSTTQLNKTGTWIDKHYRKPTPSPRTRQVINVTMNTKKDQD